MLLTLLQVLVVLAAAGVVVGEILCIGKLVRILLEPEGDGDHD